MKPLKLQSGIVFDVGFVLAAKQAENLATDCCQADQDDDQAFLQREEGDAKTLEKAENDGKQSKLGSHLHASAGGDHPRHAIGCDLVAIDEVRIAFAAVVLNGVYDVRNGGVDLLQLIEPGNEFELRDTLTPENTYRVVQRMLTVLILAEDQVASPMQGMARFVVMWRLGPADKRDRIVTLLFALRIFLLDGILDLLQQLIVVRRSCIVVGDVAAGFIIDQRPRIAGRQASILPERSCQEWSLRHSRDCPRAVRAPFSRHPD